MDQPYRHQPDFAFWRRAIAQTPPNEVDPVVTSGFKLSASDKVATAGSCFAQHISRHLSSVGFPSYATETVHPLVADFASTEYNYGTYTARYGNIYTSRQLLQLFKRAYKTFLPVDSFWIRNDGKYVDPFRPQILPEGYTSEEELEADREHHLRCVRQAFEELDVLIFTLGLTEMWFARADGAVFPVCPGVSGGAYSHERYGFTNMKVAEIVSDINEFISLLRAVNPDAKVVLTVSPVPLIATAEQRHVLVSTVYSKGALRAACEEICASGSEVFYFPSYEIITGAFNRGRYFAADCRDVTEEGVEHVMRLFLHHHASGTQTYAPIEQSDPDAAAEFERVVRVICDEEALDT